MKIAIVAEGFRPYVGGVETRYTKLAEKLARRHDVEVVTLIQNNRPTTGENVPENEVWGRVRVFRVRVQGEYFLEDGTRSLKGVREFAKRCAEKLRGSDYDVVLASEWPLLHIPYIKRSARHPIIVDWHEVWGTYYWRFGLKGVGGYLLERVVARLKGVRHVAVSEFTRNRLRKVLGVRGEIPVIWNGVDPEEYRDVSNVEREYGKILFFGRFAPHKGIDLLVEAFKEVKRFVKDASLHIVGDGPLRNFVESIPSKVDGVKVHLALPTRELLKHIASSWIAALPSSREGQGISYLEAMTAGTPVVSIKSEHNAFSSMVRDGVEALIADPNPRSLAASILRLLRDDGLWRSLSENGKVFASRFDWEKISLKLERVLRDAAGGDG